MSGNGWWWEDKDAPHQSVSAAIASINTNQGWERVQLLRWMKLYGGMEYWGIDVFGYSARSATHHNIPYNTIRSAIDTVTAKIAKNKIKPTILTYDGDFRLGRRAKKMDKFLVGQFYATKFYETERSIFKSSCITGTGILKVSSNKVEKRIVADEIFRGELKIDIADSVHGNPRSMFQERPYAKEVACAIWPRFKKEIQDAPSLADLRAGEMPAIAVPNTPLSKQVLISEAWHLPSTKDAKDGRHVICLKNTTLDAEGWERQRFPFAFLHWCPPPLGLGFWGTGICQEMEDIQDMINFTGERNRVSMRLGAVPTGFYDTNTDFNPTEMSNDVMNWHGYDSSKGAAPSVVVTAGAGAENFQFLETNIRHAYEFQGTSQLSAQSQKPAGLNSGAALDSYNDIQSERFMMPGEQREDFHIDAANLYFDEARAIAEANDGKFETTVSGKKFGRKFIETIDWKRDAELDEDKYSVQIFPQSSLPTTPAGRRQELENRVKMGAISMDDAIEQLDLPDTERSNSVLLAARYDIEETIETFLDGDPDTETAGEEAKEDESQEEADKLYRPFEPYQDPVLGLRLFKIAYLNARRAGYPETRLELLRRWMNEAQLAIQKQQAPPAQPPASPGAQPGQGPRPLAPPPPASAPPQPS